MLHGTLALQSVAVNILMDPPWNEPLSSLALPIISWVNLITESFVLKACHNNLHWEALGERWVCSTKHDPTLAVWPHVLTVPLKPPALNHAEPSAARLSLRHTTQGPCHLLSFLPKQSVAHFCTFLRCFLKWLFSLIPLLVILFKYANALPPHIHASFSVPVSLVFLTLYHWTHRIFYFFASLCLPQSVQ